MGQSDGSVIIDTLFNTDGVTQGTNRIKRDLNGITGTVKRLGRLLMTAFAVKGIVSFGKECIELGSNLAEVQNVVDSVFTTMSSQVDDFAKNAITSFGLSETMAKQFVGTFGAMAKSFKFSEAEAMQMSTTLAGLSGDVASFYNITQDEAFTKLKSVFTGETESLKQLGVVMTQSALDEYAMANGWNKTTKAMTEQEKVALRYNFVLDQLSTASGDFIRTSDGWANQIRILKLQFDSLKASIGQGLINLLTPVVKMLNILLQKLQLVANAFKQLTSFITGNNAQSKNASSVSSTASAYSSASDSAEDYTSATEDATKATKDATKANKQYISGLDEIKTWQDDTSSSSSTPSTSGGGVSGLDGSLGDAVGDMSTSLDDAIEDAKIKLSGIFVPFKEAWEQEGEKTISAIKYSFESIVSMVQSIGDSFKEVWTNGTGTTILTTIYKILQNIFTIIGNIANQFTIAWNTNSVGRDILQGIADRVVIILNFINRIAEATKKWSENIDFYPLLQSISNLIQATNPWVQKIGDTFANIYETIILPALTWLIETGIPTVLNWISNVYTFLDEHTWILELAGSLLVGIFAVSEILPRVVAIIGCIQNVIAIVQGMIAVLGEGGLLALIGPQGLIVLGISAVIFIGIQLYKNWDIIKAKAKIIWEKIVEILQGFWKNIKESVEELQETIGGIWDAISEKASEIWGAIQKAISDVWDAIKEKSAIFGEIKDAIVGWWGNVLLSATLIWGTIKSAISGVWESLKTSASTVWEGIYTIISGFAEDMFDSVVGFFCGDDGLVNTVFEAFNQLAELIKTPINVIISIINGLISGVVSCINGVCGAINSVSFEIPDWVPRWGGKSIGFNLKGITSYTTIPLLAKGAVIPPNAPFTAVLGDQKNGTNIETPEKLLRDIMREELGNIQTSGGSYQFTAQINRRTLFNEIINEAKMRQMQTGRDPFELA